MSYGLSFNFVIGVLLKLLSNTHNSHQYFTKNSLASISQMVAVAPIPALYLPPLYLSNTATAI
ncbi:hypothetical protein CXF81_08170 [Glaciecola sp. 33A]|nr:hypothetical protein CXF81_08170 [Glaciecola sp. 33A]